MPGQPKIPMITMMLKILGGKTAAAVIINRKVGKHIITSVKRMMTVSTIPPIYPDTLPRRSAIVV
jgi:hypothetical protein